MKDELKIGKKRTAVWLYPETMESIDKHFEMDNCKSRSEFIEKALGFYIGYLSSKNSTEYLSKILIGAVQATVKETEVRNANSIFRLSVEMCMIMHILAAGLEIDESKLSKLRAKCLKEVRESKGKVVFDDVVESYNE